MKNHFFTFVLLMLVSLSGCQEKKETSEQTPKSAVSNENISDTIDTNTTDTEEFNTISASRIDDLNRTIRLKKITSEEEMMQEYSPKDKNAAANYKYLITKVSSGNGKTIVQLVEENLSDDSVKDIKVIMRVIKDENGLAFVDEIKESYICRMNRGQQDWSGKLCQ